MPPPVRPYRTLPPPVESEYPEGFEGAPAPSAAAPPAASQDRGMVLPITVEPSGAPTDDASIRRQRFLELNEEITGLFEKHDELGKELGKDKRTNAQRFAEGLEAAFSPRTLYARKEMERLRNKAIMDQVENSMSMRFTMMKSLAGEGEQGDGLDDIGRRQVLTGAAADGVPIYEPDGRPRPLQAIQRDWADRQQKKEVFQYYLDSAQQMQKSGVARVPVLTGNDPAAQDRFISDMQAREAELAQEQDERASEELMLGQFKTLGLPAPLTKDPETGELRVDKERAVKELEEIKQFEKMKEYSLTIQRLRQNAVAAGMFPPAELKAMDPETYEELMTAARAGKARRERESQRLDAQVLRLQNLNETDAMAREYRARAGSWSTSDLDRIQSRLNELTKDRFEADEQLKEAAAGSFGGLLGGDAVMVKKLQTYIEFLDAHIAILEPLATEIGTKLGKAAAGPAGGGAPKDDGGGYWLPGSDVKGAPDLSADEVSKIRSMAAAEGKDAGPYLEAMARRKKGTGGGDHAD